MKILYRNITHFTVTQIAKIQNALIFIHFPTGFSSFQVVRDWKVERMAWRKYNISSFPLLPSSFTIYFLHTEEFTGTGMRDKELVIVIRIWVGRWKVVTEIPLILYFYHLFSSSSSNFREWISFAINETTWRMRRNEQSMNCYSYCYLFFVFTLFTYNFFAFFHHEYTNHSR